ncbi:MAG: biotin-dependent carboxyltransferase family protein [Saccharospirillaceae bacterium]|nr:biotin-dependent carboxyltransferase family protein [Colwellia sp.]NRB77623.1 biotin-dependent carboxyltransferase family protein [Saccharospirillaceae bacterium]
MTIHFIKAGLQTSIQDGGRQGLMHQGVSTSGAMDTTAMAMANWLVGKAQISALFEFTIIGPVIEFSQNIHISITGAKFELTLNNLPVSSYQTIHVKAGDKLNFGKRLQGARAYMAFSGDLLFENKVLQDVLGSKATHLTAGYGGINGKAIRDNTNFSIDFPERKSQVSLRNIDHRNVAYSGHNCFLRCVSAPESSLFNAAQQERFYHQTFKVHPNSNRMGLRLEGEPINFHRPMNISSSGLIQGSVQIPPSGLPIISSVDGQTIGGYPRIAVVISADLDKLAQLAPNDNVIFVKVSQAQALAILKNKQQQLSKALHGSATLPIRI